MTKFRYYINRLFFWLKPGYARGLIARFQPGVVISAAPMFLGKRTIFKVAQGGEIKVGDNFKTCRDVEIQVYRGGRMEIGDNVYVGHGSVIVCSGHMQIGSDTMIADMVTIRDKNHSFEPGKLIRETPGVVRNISIGRNCWLGSKVTVLAGAQLGNNVVVGANAVVTKTFGDNVLIGGVPAQIIREIECGVE